MADHAKINLRDEAEDQAPKFNMPDGIEARFGRKAMGDSEQSGVSYFAYAPGFKTAFGHTHSEQEETYVVVKGGGTVRVGEEDIALRTWDAVRIAPGAPHALAAGDEGMEIVAFGAGPAGDAEMIQGYW
jgi:quercetin dioxygenase-like cupin family protein